MRTSAACTQWNHHHHQRHPQLTPHTHKHRNGLSFQIATRRAQVRERSKSFKHPPRFPWSMRAPIHSFGAVCTCVCVCLSRIPLRGDKLSHDRENERHAIGVVDTRTHTAQNTITHHPRPQSSLVAPHVARSRTVRVKLNVHHCTRCAMRAHSALCK